MASIIFLGPATVLTLYGCPIVYRAARFALTKNVVQVSSADIRKIPIKDLMYYDHNTVHNHYKIRDKYYSGPLSRRTRFVTYFAYEADNEIVVGWLFYFLVAIVFVSYKLYYGYPLLYSSSPFEKYVDDFGNFVYDGIRGVVNDYNRSSGSNNKSK